MRSGSGTHGEGGELTKTVSQRGVTVSGGCFFYLVYLISFQNKTKELAILCFLQDVEFDPSDLEQAVSNLR